MSTETWLLRSPLYARRVVVWTALVSGALVIGTGLLSYNAMYKQGFALLQTMMSRRTAIWLWSVGGAANTGGGAIASLFSSLIVDRTGRTGAIFLSVVVNILGLCIQMLFFFTGRFAAMILGRMLFGAAKTVLLTTLQVFVREVTPADHRGRYANFLFAAMATGMCLELILGLDAVKMKAIWLPCIAALCGIPCLLIVPFLPDTPVHLRETKELNKMETSLWFYTGTKYTVIQEASSESEQPPAASPWEFIRSETTRCEVVIVLLLAGVITFSGLVVLYLYVTLIGGSLCVADPTLVSLSAVAAVVPFCFGSGYLIDLFGRLPVLRTTLVMLAIVMSSLFGIDYYKNSAHHGQDINVDRLVSALIILWMGLSVGIISPFRLIVGELLPYRYRAAGYSLFALSLQLFETMAAQCFWPLEDQTPGGGFLLLLVPFLFFSVLITLILPETNRRSPAEASYEAHKTFLGKYFRSSPAASEYEEVRCIRRQPMPGHGSISFSV